MLKVFCARSMHVAVAALSGQFAKNACTAPDIVFEPMGALQARLAAGEIGDVLILAAPAIDALARSGARSYPAVAPPSRVHRLVSRSATERRRPISQRRRPSRPH